SSSSSSSSNGGSKGSRNDNNRLPNQIVHIKGGQNHISLLTASRSAEETAKLAQKVATRQLQHAQGPKKKLAALHKKVRDGAAALAKTQKRATKDIKVRKEKYEQEKRAKENLRAELREARAEKDRSQRAAVNAVRILRQGQDQDRCCASGTFGRICKSTRENNWATRINTSFCLLMSDFDEIRDARTLEQLTEARDVFFDHWQDSRLPRRKAVCALRSIFGYRSTSIGIRIWGQK
ncbi:hypothetical protein A4X13_0g8144, partial [Tilletia indica]